MKAIFARTASVALVAGLTFFTGCARSALSPESGPSAATSAPPVVVAAPVPPPAAPPVAPAAVAAAPAVAVAPVPPVDTNPPAIIQRVPPTPKAENVVLSAGLTEVVKLAQAGVSEEALLAYVEQYPGLFQAGADQIIYLNDLGVSGAVIAALLKKDGSGPVAAAPAMSVVQTQVVSNVPAGQSAVAAAPEAPAAAAQASTAAAPAPTTTEVSYFYDALAPYGSWMYVSGYGWCWQPTVAASVSGWRPYLNNGSWYWSDAGWYWNSTYSWGWAPFHYGRWYYHGGCGWLWTPGVVWGPSWVSWRYSPGYCGWAPLPPAAYYRTGVGFSYYGSGVSVGFEFGLGAFHYSFVSVNYFCSPTPYYYAKPQHDHHHKEAYRNSAVVNNYEHGPGKALVNRGMGRETIARAGGAPVREAAVRTTPVQNLGAVRGERVERRGHETVIYRPELPKNVPEVRTAPGVGRAGGAATVAQPRATEPAAVGRSRTAELPGSRNAVANTPARTVTPRATDTPRLPDTGARARTEAPATTPRTVPSAPPRSVANPPAQNAVGRTAQPRTQPGRPSETGVRVVPGQAGTTATTAPRTSPPTSTQVPGRSTVARAAQTPAPSAPKQVAPSAPAAPAPGYRPAAPQNQVASPRGYEQAPRAPRAPQYSAPPASVPRQSAPAPQVASPSRQGQAVGNRPR